LGNSRCSLMTRCARRLGFAADDEVDGDE
jgi:hypothetical protein